ncbi:MAG: exonuclease domain-containing protein [Pseudonocardiaceae bacterium]
MDTAGFAVIDTETTGILPGFHHRITEIAIIHLDAAGHVTDEWCTLVNPERDLGSQAVHGIRAADVRRAPTFQQICCEVIERLRGRVPIAHNWPFDAMHLRAEFSRLGIQTPLEPRAGLCTMRLAGRALPGAGRSLVACCDRAGIPLMGWHSALADAHAAASLLDYYIAASALPVRWIDHYKQVISWPWPMLGFDPVSPVVRRAEGEKEPHFLARLVDRLPRTETLNSDSYLAMLDQVLLDRHVSATEADALVELAYGLGLHRAEVVELHHGYLRALARAAWSDGVVTGAERADLTEVATILGLDERTANQMVDQETLTASPGTSDAGVQLGRFAIKPCDIVVLTGEMTVPRAVWEERASQAGLSVGKSVTKKTKLLVAADPDSLSGKARTARQYGIPVVTEAAFGRFVESMCASAGHRRGSHETAEPGMSPVYVGIG